MALYKEPALSRIMPELLYATANSDGAVNNRSGYAFPPFLVIERGTTLLTWLEEERNFFEVIAMVEALAHLLDNLHCAGYVHRDMKARSRVWYIDWLAVMNRVIQSVIAAGLT